MYIRGLLIAYFERLKFEGHTEDYYAHRSLNYKRYRHMIAVDNNEYTYVYGLVREGNIIYVGISDTPHKRYKHHLSTTIKGLSDVEMTLLGKGQRSDMLCVESNLIAKLNPPLNKRK